MNSNAYKLKSAVEANLSPDSVINFLKFYEISV